MECLLILERDFMSVRIKEVSKFDLKSPILIEGFPGVGLVGTIAASYIVDKLKMEPLGYIVSEKFPPIAAVHNYVPLHPARIYKSKKHNLVVLFSEFTIPMGVIHHLASEITEWAREHKVSSIYSLGGISIEAEQKEVFGIASTPEIAKKLEANGVKRIKEGATTGVSGVLLAECASKGFPAASLLAEAKPDFMDPLAAAMVIEKLRALIGVDIDTAELVNESKTIESKIKDVMENAKVAHDHYKRVEGLGPMYQ
ncbi:MAG: proteasome assembly chaperone family protein [Candidatus Micrarchaeota archaeon]